ncbi:MAG: TDP-fucosamine acetyltransferase [Bacilli bacterium]|nr:TDP-fucosamine acetyltransferase [Bacilli bacterium]
MNKFEFRQENATANVLRQHGEVSIAFPVNSEFQLEYRDLGLGGIVFNEMPVDTPYWVDYDADLGVGPERWLRWDLQNWSVISVFDNCIRVGGAVMAHDTAGVLLLEARTDFTFLWDLRIDPAYRRKGIGTVLFQKCVDWTKNKGCARMRIETQHINVAACRFYAKQGAKLGQIKREAYQDQLSLVQLIWYVELEKAGDH